MEKTNSKSKKRLKIILLTLTTILFISAGGFFIWASDYYKADKIALEIMETDNEITVIDNLTILKSSETSDKAFIFYPGAKVEAISYLPMLEKLKQKGITTIIVEMPFNMAIFDSNAADDVFDILPSIKNWYIGGHSMGGAMASNYASKNKNKVEGLILLGAYIYGNYPADKALTIYGTFNSNLEKNIDYTENIVIIDGGNHAQFGNYGEQKGDSAATISRDDQQNITVDAIEEFIKQNK